MKAINSKKLKKIIKVARSMKRKRAGRPRGQRSERANTWSNGWMMATDPRTSRVLGVEQMHRPENNEVKTRILCQILPSYENVDCLIHDRACSYIHEVRRTEKLSALKFVIADKWHGSKHRATCPCSPRWVPRLKRRLRGINSSVAEQTFSWFRNYARIMNDMKPRKHAFYVLYYSRLHNALIEEGEPEHLNLLAVRKRSRRGSVPYGCE